MTIHLRLAGHQTPAVVLEQIQYLEPLPDVIQYTQMTPDGSVSDVRTIAIRHTDGDTFCYDGTAYDFLEVFA